MDKEITIFGYGSLINIHSLQKTLPNIKTITPAILKNYIRIFDTESTKRFTDKDTPICVLDIKEKEGSFLNGVYFKVSREYFDSLTQRENAYEAKKVTIETHGGEKNIPAFTFIARKNTKQKFLYDSNDQIKYLKTCLTGAKNFGEEYYKEFLETTFINQENLKEIPEIKNTISSLN